MSNGIDVTHVSDGRTHCFVLVLHEIVYLFIGWVCSRDKIVLIEVRVIRAS